MNLSWSGCLANVASDWEVDEEGQMMFLPEHLTDDRKKELSEAYIDHGWNWLSLSPVAQSQNTTEDQSGDGRRVVQEMLKCLGMRRGMDTITRLPNHEDGSEWLVCPREGMPPHGVATHELEYGLNKPEVDALMNQHFQGLAVTNLDSALHDDQIVYDGEKRMDGVEEGGETADESVGLDTGLLRVMTILSMDLLSYKAMLADDSVSELSPEQVARDLDFAGERKSARKVTQEATKGVDGAGPVLGAQHTEAILQGTGDMGLSYLQLLGLDNPYDFIPTERKAVLSRVLARSPLNTRILEICAKEAARGNRVLVLVTNPWEQL